MAKKGSGLLDILASLGFGKPKPDVPMGTNIATEIVPQESGNVIPGTNVSIGNGLADGSANLYRYHPVWMEQYNNGETNLQFADWIRQQGINAPNLPPVR